MLTGTGFNGNSEGAVYGDDWQMNTNYPIVSLVDTGGKVYYARTFNWNSTGVMRGTLPDTVYRYSAQRHHHGTYSCTYRRMAFIRMRLLLTQVRRGLAK
jgi:hypothetical protein